MGDDRDMIKRGLDEASARMLDAADVEGAQVDCGQVLYGLYRLGELAKNLLTEPVMHQKESDTTAACLWARAAETHHIVRIADINEEIFSEYFTRTFGVLVWVPVLALPLKQPDNYGRDVMYVTELEGKAVPDTIKKVFDDLWALLP